VISPSVVHVAAAARSATSRLAARESDSGGVTTSGSGSLTIAKNAQSATRPAAFVVVTEMLLDVNPSGLEIRDRPVIAALQPEVLVVAVAFQNSLGYPRPSTFHLTVYVPVELRELE